MPDLTDTVVPAPTFPLTVNCGTFHRIALLGGIYSNYLALKEALKIAKARKVDAVFVLGDFGAFGPHPNRTLEILRTEKLFLIQGNYEESLFKNAEDCHCGYTDPRDNYFAQISYDYTRDHTLPEHKTWMGTLPNHIRLILGENKVLLCHGSPRKINEFLWQTTTPLPFIKKLLRDFQTDLIVCTHTGLQWERWIEPGNRGLINAGVLGRPANDGNTHVWMTLLSEQNGRMKAEFIPVVYPHHQLAKEMDDEGLPIEFIKTIQSGWWTTCLEILPAKERSVGKY